MQQNRPTHIWSVAFTQRCQGNSWRKNSLLNKRCWNILTTIWRKEKRKNLNPYTLVFLYVTNSKWTKYLKVRNWNLKYQEGNTGENLHELGLDQDFLDKTQTSMIHQLIKIDKWNFFKIKTFSSSKDNKPSSRVRENMWKTHFCI